MYSVVRPLLFRLDAERAHALTLSALRVAGEIKPIHWALQRAFRAPENPVQAFGLTFKNPVGLAAGYDKDAVAIKGLAALGFGHIEVGTVTPLPQMGNPKPRVFRLIEDEAVINRMGFPSRGSEFVQQRLNPMLRESLIEKYFGFVPRSKRSPTNKIEKGGAILGINIGKNKNTPNEEAAMDYLALLQNFAPYADYLTVNVSSPNTEGLRQLQQRGELEKLLGHLHQQRGIEEKQLDKRVPILVKLAPDLSEAELDEALEAILRAKMDGVIVTNTTLEREGLRSNYQRESGGLSGAPLKVRSEAALRQTVKRVNGQIPIVSAGGIMNPDDAKKRLGMGAALIQIYTGLVYRGPNFANLILMSL